MRAEMEEQGDSSGESASAEFSQDEVVWAKITGYPWWPALITAAPADAAPFRVDFFADNTHAFVTRSKLAKYEWLRADVDLHKHMKKGLRRAIAAADQAARLRLPAPEGLRPEPEAVEGPPPTSKQLLQLPTIKQAPLQERNQRTPPAATTNTLTPAHSHAQTALSNTPAVVQSHPQPDTPPTPQYSLERRKKYVAMLLRKYELDNLTRGEERESAGGPARVREGRTGRKRQGSRRERRRTKKISKVNTRQHHPSAFHLLARRLHHFLKTKTGLCEPQRRAITSSLSQQVQSHHPRLETAVEQVTKLLKWLEISPPETIATYYESWSTFQSEKEKASNMTNEE